MSTSTPPIAETDWAPSLASLYRLSVERYEAMAASGVLTKRDRLHLIRGFLVSKMTKHPPHSLACEATRLAIEGLLPGGWHVRSDQPLRMPSQASVPEPDLAVARGSCWDYPDRHPEPADVAIVVEVADSSLRDNRGMAELYAAGGVPVYWIVNLVERQVEVYSDPSPAGYGSRLILKPDQEIVVVVAGTEIGRIAVAAVLPRPPAAC